MKRTTLLHLGARHEAADTSEWAPHRLAGLIAGQNASWKTRYTTPETVGELELQCRIHKVDGVVLTNEKFLEPLLESQSDWVRPATRKQITLDDYQGSMLFTPREKIPVVVLNPLINLIQVRHATHAAKRFISKLTQPGKWFPQTEFKWAVATPANLPELLRWYEQESAIISVDIETLVDDPLRRINCVGFCAYFPKTHETHAVVIPFTDMFFWGWVRKFADLQQPKVMQNGLYDSLYLLRWNIPVRNWLHDTQHLFHSMFSEYPKRLDFITAYAIRNVRYWKDDGKSGDLTDYYRYNARDCWATVNSYLSLLNESSEPYVFQNYVQEFPLVFPALSCEIEGFGVDQQQFAIERAKTEQAIVNREKDFQKMIAAPGFNVKSPQQRLRLFACLGLTKLKYSVNEKGTEVQTVIGGLASTDKAAMLKAKASTPFNERILTTMTDLSEDYKLINNYLVPEKIWNGRLHYKFNPAATDTGRLNSTASSFWCGYQIQNVPGGVSVKSYLVADPGWLLSEIDKEQAEARCVGYLAGETKLIEVVEGPNDYHAWNAQAFFGVPYDTIYSNEFKKTINKPIRDLSKRTNHGANYNMGARVMLDTMGPKYVSQAKVILRLNGKLLDVCEFLLARYAATYPRVKGGWYDSLLKEVQLTGRLVSPSGRTRIFFGKPWANKRDMNIAVAHKPQSLQVDLINDEFYCFWGCQTYGVGRRRNWMEGKWEDCDPGMDLRGRVRLKAQIHDSFVFQYRKQFPTIPELVGKNIMNSRIPVTDYDGVTRVMFIPVGIAAGATRWSDLKS